MADTSPAVGTANRRSLLVDILFGDFSRLGRVRMWPRYVVIANFAWRSIAFTHRYV